MGLSIMQNLSRLQESTVCLAYLEPQLKSGSPYCFWHLPHIIPQPGLPLGFLLSVLKESVGVYRAAGSPDAGGWFPRLRQPGSPKTAF